ncbi:MAG: cytochrome c [Pseudomonadota bacterium]|nr:cytochrome c [Pseudomonadota bacterium]
MDLKPMKHALHFKPLVGFMKAVFFLSLFSACSQPQNDQSDLSSDVEQDVISSIDADGNIAPFGFSSRDPVEIPPIAINAANENVTDSGKSGLYSIHCVACHGADANGVEGLGLSLVSSDLVANSNSADLKSFLKVGRLPDSPDSVTGIPMPGFVWMTESQLDEVVGYIKTL